MATLVNKELFEYLTHLEQEVDKRIYEKKDSKDLQQLIHLQMKEVINSEKEFLNKVYSDKTEPVLFISPNGLPSVQSLNSDLEKMCELADEEKPFKYIAKRFKSKKEEKKDDKEDLYNPVSEKKWKKELKKYKPEELSSQVSFMLDESKDGKFEIKLKEESFLKGYDDYSKKFPVLIRIGNMKYHVVWNRLIEESEKDQYYIPEKSLVLKENHGLTDVTKEIGKDGSKLVKALGNSVVKCTPNFVKGTGGFFKGIFDSLFLFPSATRKAFGNYNEIYEKKCKKETPFLEWYGLGYSSVGLPLMATLFIPAIIYGALFSSNKALGAAILASQLTSNALSGLYELYKHEKKKLDNKNLKPIAQGKYSSSSQKKLPKSKK